MLAIRSPTLQFRNQAVVSFGRGAVAVQSPLSYLSDAGDSTQCRDPVTPKLQVDTRTAVSKGLDELNEALAVPFFVVTTVCLHHGLPISMTDLANA